MVCEHLRPLELELISSGFRETFRGQPWTENCREWVYYDCVFTDPEKTMLRFQLRNDIVKVHTHLGTHDGEEHGFTCEACLDAIMGHHPGFAKSNKPDVPSFE